MKKIKRLLCLTMAFIIMAAFCASNFSTFAYDFYFSDGDFSYHIFDGKTVITEIAPKSKELNIPETVTYNGITYPVTDLSVNVEGYSNDDFGGIVETINVSKNIKTIMFSYFDEVLSKDHYNFTLKTINIPAGSKLNFLSFTNLDCNNLESINIDPDSSLKRLYLCGCPRLTKLSLPKSLKHCSFGDVPFLKIKIAKDNPYLKMKGNQVLSKDGKILYDIVGWDYNVKVNKTVNVLSSDFGNSCITKLTLGKNISKIQKFSLTQCSDNLKVIIKNKKKAPKFQINACWGAKGLKFYVQNKKVAKDLKKKLKGSKVKKAKILVGKKVIYKNVNG